jgi:hypothetical protein
MGMMMALIIDSLFVCHALLPHFLSSPALLFFDSS